MTTTFNDFLNAAWADHGKDAAGVAERLETNLHVVTEAGHIPGFANIATHVYGEHLGRWDDGTALLERIASHATCEAAGPSGRAVRRLQAVLMLCKGDLPRATNLAAQAREDGTPDASVRARIWAIAASALVGQKRGDEGAKLFEEALTFASYGPNRTDPASRALAVTANNLACDLEVRADRTETDTALMVKAAEVARTYWEIAGGWEEVMWAEYRLAMSLLAADRGAEGVKHADLAAASCAQNSASNYHRFFAAEARAKCWHMAGNKAEAAKARKEAALKVEAVESSLATITKELAALDRLLN